MTKKASEAELCSLHNLICQALKSRLESGEYNASDISNAIKFLQNNGIQAVLEAGETPDAEKIIAKLPFLDVNDDGADHSQ